MRNHGVLLRSALESLNSWVCIISISTKKESLKSTLWVAFSSSPRFYQMPASYDRLDLPWVYLACQLLKCVSRQEKHLKLNSKNFDYQSSVTYSKSTLSHINPCQSVVLVTVKSTVFIPSTNEPSAMGNS